MASFNKVLLMGNLTRDPQLKYLPSQTAVAEFGVACNRKFKSAQGEDREEVTFVDCSAFGKTGELINQYFTKGKPIFIEGRLKYDQWEDKQGGGKRSKMSVIVENFQFIGGRDGGGGGGQSYDQGGGEGEARPPRPAPAPRQQGSARPPTAGAPAATQQGPAQPAPQPPYGEESQINEDDIPF
jgi:single-strand DNA-binding protein